MHSVHRIAAFSATGVFLFLCAASPAAATERLILPRDLEYLGAFRMPNDLSSSANWASGGGGLTYRPDGDPNGAADGFPGSLFGIGKDPLVSEVSIPAPVNSPDRDPDDLPHAATLQPFVDITGGMRDAVGVDKLGGIAYLPAQAGQSSPKLYWTVFEYYNAARVNYLSHGMSDVDFSQLNAQGAWRLGSESDDDFHSMKTANYVFTIPESWANEHVGGKLLASGRHRENGAFGGCQGPAIYAYAPWQSSNLSWGTELDAVCLLRYPTGGGYFPDYCAADRWTGGVWMSYRGRSAVLIVGSKGKGEQFYGNGDSSRCSSARGFHCDPYEAQILFYNPNDLAAVARGDREPWQVLPFATVVPDDLWPMCRVRPETVAFDAAHGILYVLQYNGARIPPVGGTRVPLVHVFRVAFTRRPTNALVADREIEGEANGDRTQASELPRQTTARALGDPANVTVLPNPIASEAVVRLASPIDPASVRVAVYDLSGRLVRDLGVPTSGTVQWNTRGVGAGTYFVHVSAQGTSVTKKVLVLH